VLGPFNPQAGTIRSSVGNDDLMVILFGNLNVRLSDLSSSTPACDGIMLEIGSRCSELASIVQASPHNHRLAGPRSDKDGIGVLVDFP
jgi:hypothetical protein